MNAPTTNRGHQGWLTLDQVCEELQISRDTFYDWRKKGRAPKCAKLPNGSLRIRRSEFEKFMTKAEANA
ncbi:helix-turn-helix transcriptional regulator [Nocardiopsis baichengensis]|uniref:helix-turn-helix transcriptional regulator n=1 Tax=Nocardiopsis baichengensis TaxID=280240 RepID=UPI0003499E27|nr:helix-turn-helix domain-containing protein [Nocardiopsis baichengensis]